jgi:hypothetical protein
MSISFSCASISLSAPSLIPLHLEFSCRVPYSFLLCCLLLATSESGLVAAQPTAYLNPPPPQPASSSSNLSCFHNDIAISNYTTYTPARRPSSGWLQEIQPAEPEILATAAWLAESQPTTPSLELPSQSRTATTFPWNTSSAFFHSLPQHSQAVIRLSRRLAQTRMERLPSISCLTSRTRSGHVLVCFSSVIPTSLIDA